MAAAQITPEYVAKVEKQLTREATLEEKSIKHAEKDLKVAEKSSVKATKLVDKATHAIEKAETKEAKTARVANKAIHDHDVAASDVKQAERDVAIKKQENIQLAKTLDQRKVDLDNAIKAKEIHDKNREAKLAELSSHLPTNDHSAAASKV